MLLDKAQFRKKVLIRLLSSPITLCPFLAGASILLGVWALGPDKPGIPLFIGLSCILASFGTFLNRLVLGAEKVTQKVMEETQEEAQKAREKALDDLEARLVADGDPRTEQYFRDLRALTAHLTMLGKDSAAGLAGVDAYSAFEIMTRVEDLFDLSVRSLERTLELWNTVQHVGSDEARTPILRAREELIGEVRESIEQLGSVLAGIQKLSAEDRTSSNLGRLREELDQSIKDAESIHAELQQWKTSVANTGITPPAPEHTPGGITEEAETDPETQESGDPADRDIRERE